jgi:hypothetical protein
MKRKFNRRFYEIPIHTYCSRGTGQLGNSDFVVGLLQWRQVLHGPQGLLRKSKVSAA